ncbi:MAG: hypothetical protein RL563_1955 [Pseudomonadota bacterium]
MTVWLVGHPSLAHTLIGWTYPGALSNAADRRTRAICGVDLACANGDRLPAYTLLADSGMELLRIASQGLPRQAGRILKTAMQLAVPRETQLSSG